MQPLRTLKTNLKQCAGNYTTSQAMFIDVMDTLMAQPDRTVYDKSGYATKVLVDLCSSERLKSLDGRSHSKIFNSMRDAGLISIERNEKRTYSFALVAVPSDYVPTDEARPPKVVDPTVPYTIRPFTEAEKEALDNAPVPPLDIPSEPVTLDEEVPEDEAQVLGMRPGRLAARIERSIPTLVEDAVTRTVADMIGRFLATQGYRPIGDNDALSDAMEIRNIELASDLEMTREELRVERQMHQFTREELNKALIPTEFDAKAKGDTLRPSQLHEMFRDIAAHAIANGWSIHFTGGGHLVWISPVGKKVFSSNTPSDWRVARNHRADLEKNGLPKVR